ncbi:glycosyltransferase [Saccharomonospora sp. NPDC046836]|uniref:glycosyltransferase n=1 Tax=Saccharomonospora sp. NPDC046836 TaxID=3156921 RepID=UPI0033D469A7
MVAAASTLANDIDLDTCDLVSWHFDNLEIDQLVPALWARAGRARPPIVHHLHTLAVTLFRDHVPAPQWDNRVQQAINQANGNVYFGQYARDGVTGAAGVPAGVAWLPTTIPPDTPPVARPTLAAALETPPGRPVISLYGYAAPWKDAALLHAALTRMRAPARIVLAGDFWNDPAQAGIDLRAFSTSPAQVGHSELVVVPGYLGATDRAALVCASVAGVFPYRPHPSFQGSGAIADYLAHGVPMIATNIANMAELVGDAGHIVPAGDPQALADALDTVASGHPATTALAQRAAARAGRFTAQAHAARCLTVYQQVLDQHRRNIT